MKSSFQFCVYEDLGRKLPFLSEQKHRKLQQNFYKIYFRNILGAKTRSSKKLKILGKYGGVLLNFSTVMSEIPFPFYGFH